MTRFQDVLNESLRCLDRDDLDLCQDVCRRWMSTTGLMLKSLALRRMVRVDLKVSLKHFKPHYRGGGRGVECMLTHV